MSSESQGPGWWLASDGRWYPPEQRPGGQVAVATPPAYSYAPPVQSQTSGLAVASLVCSIIWFLGLGSLLAVIFGFVARKQIKESGGTKGGDGLAIAGIVIGFVGILTALAAIVALVATGKALNTLRNDLSTRTVSYGTRVSFSPADADGLRSLTVFGVSSPPRSRWSGTPLGGEALVTARIRACAGSDGVQDGVQSDTWQLNFSDGQTASTDPFVSVRGEGVNLTNANVAAGQCVVGYLAFDVASGARPTGVQFDGDLFSRDVNWTS